MRLSDAQIEDLNARADLGALAAQFGATLRKSGRNLIGSCPLCGGGKRATRFEIKDNGALWLCAVCAEGGDALALVQKARGCDFRAAVEFLGGAASLSAEDEARLARKRAAEQDKREKAAAFFRTQEIARAQKLWDHAELFGREGVESYLRGRGCLLPGTADIRGARAVPYFHGETVDEMGRRSPRVLMRGPAMVSAVRDNDGAFCAVHVTYLDASLTRKAKVSDPDSGEALPAKKVRGAKAGGHIVLRLPDDPKRLFLGEGIETVLSVATALKREGRMRGSDAFWSAVDLGNLGGKAVSSVAHPTLKTPGGKAQRVPGAEPDFSAPGIALPPSVTELVLLGDGDSDAFTTGLAMQRAAARYARPGLSIRIVMAPAGKDFNDLLVSAKLRPEGAQSKEHAA
jgi:hypothetical protein